MKGVEFSCTEDSSVVECVCVTEVCVVPLQTSVQVPSPAAGVIEELLVPDGGKVEGGTPLFRLKKGGQQRFF